MKIIKTVTFLVKFQGDKRERESGFVRLCCLYWNRRVTLQKSGQSFIQSQYINE